MIDTNVVLDWLVFDEPSVAPLVAAVTSGRVRWLATAAMREELSHVLERGLAAARGRNVDTVLAAWDARAALRPVPPAHGLVCDDPDDQKFVDLALAAGARWLITRDGALLRLARRAARQRVAIIRPQAWQLDIADNR